MQAYQKRYLDTRHGDVEYAVGSNALLSAKNLHLHGTRKFREGFVGPFVVTEHIVEPGHHLDLSQHTPLK